ncbi:hypothetical protein Fot_15004 [Forsythia ovata]|uniref:Uncharacterized protein n=1 Tax=Forsythia ovata TaxID=205694 RepID=A0ABD1W7X5_9LAMI
MKAVEKPDVDEQPREMRVKKPSQWVTSPYMTEGQWRKHNDATAVNHQLDHLKLNDAKNWFHDVFTEGAWLSNEVDIAKLTMFINDLDRSSYMDDQIRTDLKPMTMILSMLLKKINIVIDALTIERITKTSKQSNS